MRAVATISLPAEAAKRLDERATSDRYRPEIDGVRAIAVLPVVFFHAGFPISGGFLGVDVFYVISGFLITSILYREINEGRFSGLSFYERRLRRIVPLMLVVVLASSVFAWMTMSALDLKSFGDSALATLCFVANAFFRKSAAYFQQGVGDLPLIHMWSLAVEEQYYIVFPAFFFIATRFFNHRLLAVLLVLVLGDLLLAQFVSLRWPRFSFYMFPTRAWEPLAGGAAAVFMARSPPAPSRWLAGLGLSLVAGSYVFGSSTMVHPGFSTVPTVLGTVLLMLFAAPTEQIGAGLSQPAMRFIGKISYGLYLWHQPIFAFFRLYSLRQPTTLESCVLILAVVGLSYLTFSWIEQPFRDRRRVTRRQLYLCLSVFTPVVALAAMACAHLSYADLMLRPKPLVSTEDDRSYCPRPVSYDGGRITGCMLGDSASRTQFALLGDSSANALRHALDVEALRRHIAIVSLAVDGCQQIAGYDARRFSGGSCATLQSRVLNFVTRSPDITGVILLNRWTLFLERTGFDNGEGGVENTPVGPLKFGGVVVSKAVMAAVFPGAVRNTVKPLLSARKTVLVLYPIPEAGWLVPRYLQNRIVHGDHRDLSTSYTLVHMRDSRASAGLDEGLAGLPVTKIYPERTLCATVPGGRCAVSRDLKPLYFDSGHLSREGAQVVTSQIMNALPPPRPS
jgi:peptidoglycan/LPS O-acetylase OafA/YrhL